jgi:GNAT superfamily N-acetyltransferase
MPHEISWRVMEMEKYLIEELTDQPGQDIAEILAAAYVSNPLHVAAFPGDEEARLCANRALFALATSGMVPGTWLCARGGNAVFGALRYACSPACIFPPEVQSELGRIMAQTLGEAGTRVAGWFKSWADVHPEGEHWHLGPFAVAPERQGRGIGSLLIEEYVCRMDAARAVGYLETDRPKNVLFYEKFGFRLTREDQVIGVRNWFMERPASGLK